MTMTYFTARPTYVAYAFEWRKTVKMSFKGENLQKMSNRTEYLMILKTKQLTPEAHTCMSPPQGNMHVYYHNIQTSSLKLLGQSKPNST